MKGLSNTAWAVVAVICLLLVALFTYLWAVLGSTAFAVAMLVAAVLFVYGVNCSMR